MFKSSIRAMAAAGAVAIAIGTIFASKAEAHNNRHRHNHRPRTVVVTPWFAFWQSTPQPRVRINEHCVYKPWNNRTVCRY